MKQAKIDLNTLYNNIRKDIESRLKDFRHIYESRDMESIKHEMLFCILTPQSKAKVCWACLSNMIENENIDRISEAKIRKYIGPVRFYNNKTLYMHTLIEDIRNNKLDIREMIFSGNDAMQIRDMLVKQVKGYGYKESSHFLRNIGIGEDIAILDRHILRNLLLYGIIPAIPAYLSRKKYVEIENRMRDFASELDIPIAHLDILLWYKETGEIFK